MNPRRRAGLEKVGQAAILGLALIVAWFGLEAAIHSVHHLADPDEASLCAVLSASQHLVGACDEGPDTGTPTLTVHAAPPGDTQGIRPLQLFRPFEGRAPPATPSV